MMIDNEIYFRGLTRSESEKGMLALTKVKKCMAGKAMLYLLIRSTQIQNLRSKKLSLINATSVMRIVR
jgi:hypothetical protein